jgi:hypothetical protein
MKLVTISIFFLISNLSFAETALTRELLNNPNYKEIYEQIKNDEALSTAGTTVQDAIKRQSELESDPSARAKLYYQEKLDSSPCPHCPKYLDLVLSVNNIVEKIDTSDVALGNEKIAQLSKLKFLYYLTKSEIDGKSVCNKSSRVDPISEKALREGSIKLLAEKALSLPNVTDVQFYEANQKEVHYFYQGEEEDNNTIIEVVILPDRTAVLKYYRYESGIKLPDIGSRTQTLANQDKNFIEINPKIETENLVLPTDISFGKARTSIDLPGGLELKHDSDFAFNQQKGNVTILNADGEKFLLLEGVNNSGGSKGGSAIVNYNFLLDKDSDLKLGTAVGTNVEIGNSLREGIKKSEQNFELGLTDHNNEYFKVKSVVDSTGLTSYGASNKLKLGDGAIGGQFNFDKTGEKTYGVNLEKQGIFDRVGAKYIYTATGEKKYAASVGATVARDTILTTEYTNGGGKSSSIAMNFEKKINETTTMVLTVNNSKESGTNLMYQFQTKF